MMTSRREFVSLLGGAAVAWPTEVCAQLQAQRVKRMGVLIGTTEGDADGQSRLAALRKGLVELGWSDNQNIQIDVRWAASEELTRTYAAELVSTKPDVIVANGTPASLVFRQITQTIPIVFVQVTDPVGQNLVQSLARPDGNLTGFTNYEFEMGGKWLQLLKEIAPRLDHVVAIFHPPTAPFATSFRGYIEAAAQSLSLDVLISPVHTDDDIKSAIELGARRPNTGLMVIPGVFMTVRREMIVALAARERLPALYPFRYFATSGGLMAYGVDVLDLFRRSASYVDRLLKGEAARDLPVQQPTKFELVINLKTAKALGIEVPPMLLARADEVIE